MNEINNDNEIVINTKTAFLHYLFVGFKTKIFCSVHSIRFMKYGFTDKI